MNGPRRALAAARARSGFLDHVVRMVGRYGQDRGDNLAAVITLPAFLSFFPLVALALSVAGYVAHYDAGAQAAISRGIEGFFPGLVGPAKGQIDVAGIAGQRAATGAIGLAGLLLGGLGWIDAMRQSLRLAWHQPQLRANFLLVKAGDVLVLLIVGLAAVLSLALTALATAAATLVAHHLAAGGGTARVLLQALALAAAVAGDMLLFAVLFIRLPDGRPPLRQVAGGVLFGGIGLELLKTAGVYYIARTTHNPLYASFAVVVGLLVWVNLIARLFVYAAVWTVTGPYTSDRPPSAGPQGAGAPAAGPDGADRRPGSGPG